MKLKRYLVDRSNVYELDMSCCRKDDSTIAYVWAIYRLLGSIKSIEEVDLEEMVEVQEVKKEVYE